MSARGGASGGGVSLGDALRMACLAALSVAVGRVEGVVDVDRNLDDRLRNDMAGVLAAELTRVAARLLADGRQRGLRHARIHTDTLTGLLAGRLSRNGDSSLKGDEHYEAFRKEEEKVGHSSPEACCSLLSIIS